MFVCTGTASRRYPLGVRGALHQQAPSAEMKISPAHCGDTWAGSVQVLCLNLCGTRQLWLHEFDELKMVALQAASHQCWMT